MIQPNDSQEQLNGSSLIPSSSRSMDFFGSSLVVRTPLVSDPFPLFRVPLLFFVPLAIVIVIVANPILIYV